MAWTGTEMIVWGGGDANTDLADGAAYDPATNSWRKRSHPPRFRLDSGSQSCGRDKR